jgi:hypothetical protein
MRKEHVRWVTACDAHCERESTAGETMYVPPVINFGCREIAGRVASAVVEAQVKTLDLCVEVAMKKHVILFLAANPGSTDRLALDREARAIQVELERSGHREQFAFETRWAAEPLDLLRALRTLRPTVVHYSGHGGQNGLFFQASDGQAFLVPSTAIAETFGAAGASVRLVVLNACYSEQHAEAMLAHVDCVVGMDGAVLDDAARSFAIGFYGGLGERESVAAAYRQGCAAVSLEAPGDRDRRRDVADREPRGQPADEPLRPRLKVRPGVDADRLVLGADPHSPRLHRRGRRGRPSSRRDIAGPRSLRAAA